MKVTINWLKQYVDFDWSPEELADRLTMLGLEVEGVESWGGGFDGVVVAEVISREKHPNADRLSLCLVHDGSQQRQIVCGATNFKAGDKVALILPGASLPAQGQDKPFTIKTGKIRGVESQGMMCSPKELGISEDAEGLLVLPADATVGQPLTQHLGLQEKDTVFDLEITPNRPDLNSVIGIAREIAAVTGNPLSLPQPLPADDSVAAAASSSSSLPCLADFVKVRIDDPDLCPRYTARVITGTTVGPSPDWLRLSLEKVGIRSINNVVDVTNYVMLETGQPLHAFDYHLLHAPPQGKPTIVVRRAANGETFQTLDERRHKLTDQNLLIADESKGIALAGIMGGANTEIQPTTKDILLESAYFTPAHIRRTSKQLDLRSESSYRFERGCDIGAADWASRRAAQLILETAGGQLIPGAADVCPSPPEPREIALRFERTNRLLGISIPPETQETCLASLQLQPVPAASSSTESQSDTRRFRIPTFRVDLKEEIDLVEEVCRLHGLDKITPTPPRGAHGENAFDALHDQMADLRRLLAGLGLDEAQGQTLISDQAAAQLSSETERIPLQHPLSSDMNVLRPSLLPGLLHALQRNTNHKNPDIALFELGRVFLRTGAAPLEERRLALALTGHRHPHRWARSDQETLYDILDLKGILETILDHLGIRGISPVKDAGGSASEFWQESASLILGKQSLGRLGMLNPQRARALDLRQPVFLAELYLDRLLSRPASAKTFKPLPAFPPIRRDVALLIAEETTHENIVAAVRETRPANLEQVEPFDIFRGANVPPGQKSMAYAFTYRSRERTLTDDEVNKTHEKIVRALQDNLGATIR